MLTNTQPINREGWPVPFWLQWRESTHGPDQPDQTEDRRFGSSFVDQNAQIRYERTAYNRIIVSRTIRAGDAFLSTVRLQHVCDTLRFGRRRRRRQ